MTRARAAATNAAALDAGVAVSVVVYLGVRDGDPPDATTTTNSTSHEPTDGDVAEALAGALGQELRTPLDAGEAGCLAVGVLGELGRPRLEQLSERRASLTESEQEVLVRAVVRCLPEDKAAALLSDAPDTTVVLELPDEGG
jgi:hypothetical protein